MRKRFKKAMSLVLSAAMAISLASGVSYSPASAAEGGGDNAPTGAASGSAVGAYTAIVGFQTSDYDCREISSNDGLNKAKEASVKYNEWLKEQGKEVPPYNNVNIYLNGNVAGLNAKTGNLSKPEKVELYSGATVTDAKMSEDGEYTVGISGLNLIEDGKDTAGEEIFNMLRIDTDIPMTEANKNVKIKASSIKVNGEELLSGDVEVPYEVPYNQEIKDRYEFMIADISEVNHKITALYNDKKTLKVPDGSFDIEMKFAIEGADWASAPLPDATPTPEPSQPAQSTGPEVTPPPVVSIAPFDIYVASNVNFALTPDEGEVGSDGKVIQSAVFASKEIKAKIDAAKSKDGKPLFTEGTMLWRETDPNTSSKTISQTGEYELSVTARGDSEDLTNDGAIWFPLLINGTDSNMPKDFNLVGKSITVGEGDAAKTYNWPTRLIQDGQGSVRLTVCNQWADATLKEISNAVKDVIPVKKGDKLSFKFYVTPEKPAPAPTATPAAISTAPATSYNAYLSFQTDTFVFRDTFNNDTYGLNSKDIDYKNEIGYWDGAAADTTKPARLKVAITDAVMTDNTAYNVSIKGANLQTLKGNKSTDTASTAFNMVSISTDIPLAMKGVTMEKATLKIDGQVVKEYTVVPCKGDAVGYYQFMLADGYAPADGTKDAAYPSGDLLKVLPTDSIEISYTMKGVDFDRRDVGPAKGKTFSAGDFKYKVTKTAVQSGDKAPTKGTVQVVGLSKKGKKKASVSLGATAKVKVTSPSAVTATYKITTMKKKAFAGSSKLKKFNAKKATNLKALSAGAFTNCKKLTSVVLGKKMNKIPATAFKGCKKLSSITCNAKLKSVSKSAFKGCKKKIKIAGKSKAANKKKIKKAYKKVK